MDCENHVPGYMTAGTTFDSWKMRQGGIVSKILEMWPIHFATEKPDDPCRRRAL
jgi:hypothetical protein